MSKFDELVETMPPSQAELIKYQVDRLVGELHKRHCRVSGAGGVEIVAAVGAYLSAYQVAQERAEARRAFKAGGKPRRLVWRGYVLTVEGGEDVG